MEAREHHHLCGGGKLKPLVGKGEESIPSTWSMHVTLYVYCECCCWTPAKAMKRREEGAGVNSGRTQCDGVSGWGMVYLSVHEELMPPNDLDELSQLLVLDVKATLNDVTQSFH
jgi:hypothetical protein